MQIHHRHKCNLFFGRRNNKETPPERPHVGVKQAHDTTCSTASEIPKGLSLLHYFFFPPPSWGASLWFGLLEGYEVFQHVTASNEAELEGSEDAALFVGSVITSPHGNDTKTANDWWIVHELCFVFRRMRAYVCVRRCRLVFSFFFSSCECAIGWAETTRGGIYTFCWWWCKSSSN